MHHPSDNADAYEGPERRVAHRRQVADMAAEEMGKQLSELENRLVRHINAKSLEVITKIDSLLQSATDHTDREIARVVEEAFPPGPLYRHRDFHVWRIEQAKREADRDEKIKTDLYSWAIRGALMTIGGMILLGFLEWLKRELNK